MREIRNWAGIVRFRPARVETPDSVEAVRNLVRRESEAGRRVRVVGSAHSFTPLIETDETLVSLDEFQGVESVDPVAGVAVVRAGTKLRRLSEELLERGFALENLGDVDRQSIAGAMLTGTHGTGIGLGNVASQAVGLTLVLASGEVAECSETENPDLFRAARVSLGALGVVVRARLRVLPAYRLLYSRVRSTLAETRERIDEHVAGHRHFEIFQFPHDDRVLLKFLDPTDRPADPRSIRKFVLDVVLENWLFGLASSAVRRGLVSAERVSRFCAANVGSGEEIDWSHRLFATPRLVRFVETEWSVPAARGFETFEAIGRAIRDRRIPVHFPVELRYTKADDAWLGPAYGRDSAFVACHTIVGMPHEEYFAGATEIFREREGRPHWGKLHPLGAEELRPLYPMWDRFRELRAEADPRGTFMNAHLRRVLG